MVIHKLGYCVKNKLNFLHSTKVLLKLEKNVAIFIVLNVSLKI